MFQVQVHTRFIIFWVVLMIIGVVGNGFYAQSLLGHYQIGLTVMGHVLMQALPIWLLGIFLLNLFMWALSAIPPFRPSGVPGNEWIFYAVLNSAILLISTGVFFGVANELIERYPR